MSGDPWLTAYDQAQASAAEVLQLIQDRNVEFPDGGPGASRMTATARRSLGALGTKLDALRASIESESGLSENEKNRRRDMVSALRSRRESLLAGLKREGGGASAQRAVLLGSVDASSARPRESATTAPLDASGLISLQRQTMEAQDRELEHLERGVASTKQVALRINEETTLQNRLLEDLDDAVATTTSRMGAAQRRLRKVMAAGGWSCQKQLLIVFMLVLLVVLVVAILRVVTK